jgi:hypothetical protein
MRRAEWLARPSAWAELFALANIAFLALDIFLAHSTNAFAQPAEWVPLIYSLAAPVLLVVAMILGGPVPSTARTPGRKGLARTIGLVAGWAAIVVGVAGLVLHLESHFFREQTLRNLVYTAPFAAPLAYAGLGLLMVMDRMVDDRSIEWARWVILLAMGGFAGNFVLSLSDHAQNGFFYAAEWIAVVAAAVAVGTLTAAFIVYQDRGLRLLALWVMAAQVVVGVLGFAYHVRANLLKPLGTLWDRFVFGAPAFAPLLFANLAALAVIGLVALEWAPHAGRQVAAPDQGSSDARPGLQLP